MQDIIRKRWKTSNCGLGTPLPSCRIQGFSKARPAQRRFPSVSIKAQVEIEGSLVASGRHPGFNGSQVSVGLLAPGTPVE